MGAKIDYGRKIACNLAKIYGKDLNDIQEKYYGNYFNQFTSEQVMVIFNKCVATFKFFPSISELMEVSKAKQDLRDDANEMVGTILNAIKVFGRYQEKEAMISIGGEAWFAIERFGGWNLLCDSEIDQMGTIRAQLRDICHMVLTMRKRDITRIKELSMKHEQTGTIRLFELINKNFIDVKVNALVHNENTEKK